jgi:hypothetical protein
MDDIATTFTDRTFRYTQIDRQGDIAVYTQQHKDGGQTRYEVVRIRVRAAHTWPNGETTPEHEAYPGASVWGKDGWTFFTLAAAQAHAAILRGQQAETQPEGSTPEPDADEDADSNGHSHGKA